MRFTPAISLTLAVSLIQAQPQPAQPPQPKAPQIPIQQFKLDNGLRIVMSEDHSAPTYAISVTYNVGSHNEQGWAHWIRAPIRTHDVSRLRSRRQGRAYDPG